MLFLLVTWAAQGKACRLDAGRSRCRYKRTFLLRDTPATVHFDSIYRVPFGCALAPSTRIRQTDRVADIGIPDWVWPAAELLHNAPRLVLRARRRSNDLEQDTRELARLTTNVEHAVADRVREPARH